MDEPAYKGVMLSNPPGGNDGAYATTYGADSYAGEGGAPPFLAAGKPYEQLGLAPAQKVRAAQITKKESIITKHKRWLSQWKKKAKAKRVARDSVHEGSAETSTKIGEFNSNLRKAILNNDDVTFWKPVQKAHEIADTLAKTTEIVEERIAQRAEDAKVDKPKEDLSALDAELEALVAGALEKREEAKAAEAAKPAVAKAEGGAGKAAAAKGASKPAWARTEDEEDELEEAEEDELLKFAEGLDYDKLIEEMEDADMKDAVKTMAEAERDARGKGEPLPEQWKKGFVRAMNHMANVDAAGGGSGAGGDGSVAATDFDAAGSTITSVTAASKARADAIARERAERASKKEEPQWDSSTVTGGREAGEKLEVMRAAEEFLRENPELKGVHSVDSARAALEKVATPQPIDVA